MENREIKGDASESENDAWVESNANTQEIRVVLNGYSMTTALGRKVQEEIEKAKNEEASTGDDATASRRATARVFAQLERWKREVQEERAASLESQENGSD